MEHQYSGAPTFSGALHKMKKEVTKAGKMVSSDDTFRNIVDKAQGALAFDAIKKAVIKATSLEHGPPKEKHLQTLLTAVGEGLAKETFYEIVQRLHSKDATTVLKSLMVFHRLLRETPSRDKLYGKCHVYMSDLRLPKFMDSSTAESMQASTLVRNYAGYLEEKMQCVRSSSFEYDKDSAKSLAHVGEIVPEQVMQDVKSLMALLDTGYACSIREQSNVHPTSVAAFSLVFKDLRILYQSLNKAILRLLESYFEMPKVIAVKILVMYKEYLDHTKRVGRVFEDARTLLGQDKVELSTPPESFLESLERYLEEDEYTPTSMDQAAIDDAKSAPVIPLSDLIGSFEHISTDSSQNSPPSKVPTTALGDDLLDFFSSPVPAPVTRGGGACCRNRRWV